MTITHQSNAASPENLLTPLLMDLSYSHQHYKHEPQLTAAPKDIYIFDTSQFPASEQKFLGKANANYQCFINPAAFNEVQMI